MKINILRVYSFAVCFLSLMCGAIVLGLLSYSIVKTVSPGVTVSAHELRQVSSNDEFRQAFGKVRLLPDEEDKITILRQQEHRQLIDTEFHNGRQKIMLYGIIFLINLIMYVTHWRIGKHSLSSPDSLNKKAENTV
jgi:hypothetical protein